MVVADQGSWQADVVFVIEGTANISPYIESLKLNYIIPTLECFNGASASAEDKDCGIDSNSTLYALVVFMAADCAPESAATCQAPTSSTQKFLSWLDKTKFIGGAGESHSHVAEGLSTALQVFDDFQAYRENSVAAQKHCILISNSPPYPLPSLESVNYSNLMTEQLAAMMAERQINFSVLSPRKIPTLFKLYEKAGGDLQLALTKNYAKDRRHLVLLKGFQLQERPMSPPSMQDSSKGAVPSVSSPPAAQKRPATSPPPHAREFKQPATQANYGGMEWNQENPGGNMAPQNPSSIQPPNQGQMPPYGPNPGQNMPQRPGMPNQPSHLNPLNQPNPPNVTITNKGPPQHSDGIRPQRGHSPVPGPPRMAWNQQGAPSSPASTPPTTSVLATQLNMAPSNMPMRNPQMGGNPGGMVSQSMNSPQNVLNAPGNMRGPMQNMNLRMANTSPGPLPPGGPLQVQLAQHQGGFPQQNLPNAIQAKLANANAGQMLPGQQQQQAHRMGGAAPPAVTTKDRRTIWRGNLDFQAKIASQQEPRVMHSVPCTISSVVNNGESDVNADKWPNQLVLQLIPRQLIVMANLFNTLKSAARHVLIHFNEESEALAKLCQNMSGGLVGCVQFPPTCDIRIMVVLYMPDKRIYMGFIANDQDGFFTSIRQIYENYRKQKQRVVQGAVNITQPSEGMGISSTNTTNPNMMMAQQGGPSAMGNSQMMGNIPPSQPPPQPQQQPPPPQAAGMAGANSQANSARLNQLEAARQQNLLKIQQLQQTLEAAQQKEMQFKLAQEQQKQQQQQQQAQQQQQLIERQNNIRHLQQQLQHQQQQAANLQMQQVNQQLQNSQNQHNPQLRNLLQQQVQVQQMRRQQQHQQMLMQQQQQQHPQGIRSQLPPGGIGGNQQQPPQQPQQQSWGMKKMQ